MSYDPSPPTLLPVFSLRGLTHSAGPRPFAAMEAPSFVATFPAFVPSITSSTSYPPPTILAATASPNPVLSRLKTFCASATPVERTPTLPCTNGVTFLVQTGSAQPSCFSDALREPVYRYSPNKSNRSTFFLRLLPKTTHILRRKYIMIDRSYLFRLCHEANRFFFKIRNLRLGLKRAESSKLDLTSSLMLLTLTVVPLFDRDVCFVLFLLFLLRTTLHLFKPPLRLPLRCLVDQPAFNCVLPLLLRTLRLPLQRASLLSVLLNNGISSLHSREDQEAG